MRNEITDRALQALVKEKNELLGRVRELTEARENVRRPLLRWDETRSDAPLLEQEGLELRVRDAALVMNIQKGW